MERKRPRQAGAGEVSGEPKRVDRKRFQIQELESTDRAGQGNPLPNSPLSEGVCTLLGPPENRKKSNFDLRFQPKF